MPSQLPTSILGARGHQGWRGRGLGSPPEQVCNPTVLVMGYS